MTTLPLMTLSIQNDFKMKRKHHQAKNHTQKALQHISQLPVQQRLEHALALINTVVFEQSQAMGVPRLSPFHLDIIVGDLSQDLTEESEKISKQIYYQTRSQVPSYWRKGTVYCLHTKQALTPSDPMMIFQGYDVLGRPQWQSFLQACLEAQVSGIETAFSEHSQPIALLKLPPFAPKSLNVESQLVYEVLGQLSIGPVNESIRAVRPQDTKRVLSIQILKLAVQQMPLEMRVNVLGFTEDEIQDGAARGEPRGPLAQIRNQLQFLQKNIAKLSEKNQKRLKTDVQVQQEVDDLLNTFKDAVLKIILDGKHRTHHARHRHYQMTRPTSQAWHDAAKAGKERLFFDQHHQTYVVIGPKRRAHIFNQQGKHVTSMRLGHGEVDKKQASQRWVLLTLTQQKEFALWVQNQAMDPHTK